METHNTREWIDRNFLETNPRATLLDGHIYFRDQDVINFLHQGAQKAREEEKSRILNIIGHWKTKTDEGSQEVDRLYLAIELERRNHSKLDQPTV